MEGNILERSMSSRNAAASFQSTVALPLPSRNCTSSPWGGSVQHLPVFLASVNSGERVKIVLGMALCKMHDALLKKALCFVGILAASATVPSSGYCQLVRESPTTKEQQNQNDSSTQPPPGKKRVSQEVQLTGDASWTDTGIDVLPAEHVLITATGKLRYADANEDNGPEGLARGFKDILRILPYNEAGRGALIGCIGDKETA